MFWYCIRFLLKRGRSQSMSMHEVPHGNKVGQNMAKLTLLLTLCIKCTPEPIIQSSTSHIHQKMPPKAPQTAYHLYIRFRKIIFSHPSLELSTAEGNRELYLNFVEAVLNTSLDGLPRCDKAEKFIGSESFTAMSKKLGKCAYRCNCLSNKQRVD